METSVEARNWLKETEDLFAILDVEDRRKVLLAVWLLKGEAAYWWVVTTTTRPIETWDEFKRRFGLRFLSSVEENLQMERFLSLKQGDMTIREYVDKFNQLARFGLDLVNTAQKKAMHFALGLNEPLRGLAISHIPIGATFESLVNVALLNEENRSDKKEIKVNESQNKKMGPKKEIKKKEEKSKDKKEKRCFTCGSSTHLNKDCRKRKGTCFNCGEMGHFTRDCPKKQGQGQGQTQRAGPSGGQVHALNTAPVPDRGSISVESLVYITDFPVRTLFDSGASHSLFHLV